MHLGINVMEGRMSVFDCKTEVTNMAAIVCVTRALIAKTMVWSKIEQCIYERFARPDGVVYDDGGSLRFANQMLNSIPEGEFRGYLPEGKAIMFHEAGQWQGYPESVWRWQCLPESRYRKD